MSKNCGSLGCRNFLYIKLTIKIINAILKRYYYYKNKKVVAMLKLALKLVILFGLNSASMALEEMAEDELSLLSARDGVSVLWKMDDNGVRIDSVALVDKNGIDTSILAGYGSAGKLLVRNVGLKTCAESTINGSCTALFLPTLRFDIDAIGDHNGNGVSSPMLNISLTLGGGANKIRFYIDKVAISNSAGSNEKTLIDFGGRIGADIDPSGDYIDIVPQGSNKMLLNLQLGFQRQGHMIQFANGNFGTIDVGTVSFLDGQTPANSLRFGLKIDEFDITGSGIDIDKTGLMFRSADFGKGLMDITLSDIKMGDSTAVSMGSIGIQNIKVTNFAITIAGKL